MAQMDIKTVKEKVAKGLEHARWNLLEAPGSMFIGEMLLRFSIVPVYDCRCTTACTDGTKIYFDCEFYSKLTPTQREFVLAHEVWHNCFLHFTRMHGRNPQLWNIATDMEINHMLKNEGMDVLKDACLPDPIVAGKNAEDIYAYLMKEMDKNRKNQKNQNDDSDGGSDDGDSDGQSDDSNDGDSEGQNGSSKGDKNKKGNQTGNQNGGGNSDDDFSDYGNQFDKHIYEGDDAGQGEETEGKWGPKGFDDDFNPSMKNGEEVAEKIKDAVCSVAQSIERKKGRLPGGIDAMVKKLLKPEINWKEALSQFVTKVLGCEHSWKRVSRHALARGHYLPGRMDDNINIGLILDTSGSYLGDLPKFLSELDSLLRSFGKYQITLIQCDAEVQDVQKYDESNPMDFDKFEAKGFGGSDARPAFKWIRENGEDEVNCVVMFTDGYIDVPTYAPPYPTLFVLTSDGNENLCEWGEKMRFKPQSND